MKALKTREYDVSINGKTYRYRIELHESGAAQYGNQTCVAVYDGLNAEPQVYDTRYEAGIKTRFEQWADDFIKGYCNPKCEIRLAAE